MLDQLMSLYKQRSVLVLCSAVGIYLTNPLGVVSEAAVLDQLTSDSVLLVRRSDIILRWTNSANLGVLLTQNDARWRTMNVVGKCDRIRCQTGWFYSHVDGYIFTWVVIFSRGWVSVTSSTNLCRMIPIVIHTRMELFTHVWFCLGVVGFIATWIVLLLFLVRQ